MFRFNIRVYGVLINSKKQVLVSDEMIKGKPYTKFPGGGLEYGEGTRDCLKREFLEELGLLVEVGNHIYTTDFFQPSYFHPDHQIISIYYLVHPQAAFDFDETQIKKIAPVTENFRLVDWIDLTTESVSLPIDKIVVQLLKET